MVIEPVQLIWGKGGGGLDNGDGDGEWSDDGIDRNETTYKRRHKTPARPYSPLPGVVHSFTALQGNILAIQSSSSSSRTKEVFKIDPPHMYRGGEGGIFLHNRGR